MNSKIRALVWEELRVGGAIAGAVLFSAVLIQLVIHAEPNIARKVMASHGYIDPLTLLCTLGYPLLLVLLLTLNTANTGHLRGGFSRRILRLPVETSTAVFVALFTRVVLVLAVSGSLNALAWALFGAGATLQSILFFGMVYLLVQTLDWLRGVAQSVVIGLVALAVCVAFLDANHSSGLIALIYSPTHGAAFLWILFPLSAAISYVISLAAVHLTRCGYQLGLLPSASMAARDRRTIRPRAKKPFASLLSAQFWYEVRHSGWIIPAATALFWVGGLALRWLMLRNDHWTGTSSKWTPRVLDPLWSCEIIPYVALLGAAVAHHLIGGFRDRKKTRPTDFLLRLPVIPVDMARAELMARGVSLGGTFAVVALIGAAGFLSEDGGSIGRLLIEALAAGETTLREVVPIVVGPPLLAGLAAWSFVGNEWSRRYVILGAIFGGLVGLDIAGFLFGSPFLGPAQTLASVLVFVALVYPIAGIALTLRRFRGSHLLSAWPLASCFLIWVALMAALFPYTAIEGIKPLVVTAFVCAALAALPVAPFFTVMRRYAGTTAWETPPVSHQPGFRPGRVAGLILIVTILLGIAAARSAAPSDRAAVWHSRGWPATMAELEATYPPVPDDENLASRYLAASGKLERLQSEDKAGDDSKEMIVGIADVATTEQIPPDVWRATKHYWDAVGKDVADDLHRAAHSGLTKSRFPVDLRHAFSDPLPHMAELRGLARVLMVEALVASVERRPDEAVEANLDIVPLAESLRSEPLLISQMMRVAIESMATGSIAATVNRMILDDAHLAELASGLQNADPARSDNPPFVRAAMAERIISEAYLSDLANGLVPGASLQDDSYGRLADSVLVSVRDTLGCNAMNRIVEDRVLCMEWDEARKTEERGYLDDQNSIIDFNSPTILMRAPHASMMMGICSMSALPEWLGRARLDTARGAIAVERFRLANHRLPDQLGDIVPRFLTEVPRDPFNHGAPLSYRTKADGTFVVYSYGQNFIDDYGELESSNHRPGGDITFTVAPPAIRERPQVATEDQAGAGDGEKSAR